jgi:hypothetical protein
MQDGKTYTAFYRNNKVSVNRLYLLFLAKVNENIVIPQINEELLEDDKKELIDECLKVFGRHAIELSKRGFTITGIDISQTFIRGLIEKINLEALILKAYKRTF